MNRMNEFVLAMGVPSAIMGLVVWWLKRHIDKQDEKRDEMERKRDEREGNMERLMILIMQTSKANNVLAEATARAVQRIPDAQCNGDMTEALKKSIELQREQNQFLIDQGVKHIFGDD